MWAAIAAVAQLIYLIVKNKFDRDDLERKRKEVLHAQWTDAVRSGDVNRINDILAGMRTKSVHPGNTDDQKG